VHYYQGLHYFTIAQSNEDEVVKPPKKLSSLRENADLMKYKSCETVLLKVADEKDEPAVEFARHQPADC